MYLILDNNSCYLDTVTYHGNENMIKLYKTKEDAENHIKYNYRNKGYKVRYLKTASEVTK